MMIGARITVLMWVLAAAAGCVQERNIPLHRVECLNDAQCGAGRFCRDGVCAQTPSRPTPDVREFPDIDREVLEDNARDVFSPPQVPVEPDRP